MTHAISTSTAQRQRLKRIADKLEQAMPEAEVELRHHSPWELLIATILSAQCTDERINHVTPSLFRRYRTAAALAKAKLPDVEQLIRSTGFFKSKAKNIVACSEAIAKRFHGTVPTTMDELVTLPGVGRKTANVLLGNAFGKPAIVVDTHVKRVANRLALTMSEDPNQIELDLQALLPPTQWTAVSQRLLLHGRYHCTARAPKCKTCSIETLCPWKGKGRA
jgi:endonuclease-3